MMTWHDLAGIILTLGVSISLVLLIITQVIHDGHLTTDETTVIATVLGAAVGAVATYLGTRADK